MTRDELQTAIHNLFKMWEKSLLASHSLPVVCLCVGLDEKSGLMVVCADAEHSLDTIRAFISSAQESICGRVLRVEVKGEGEGAIDAN